VIAAISRFRGYLRPYRRALRVGTALTIVDVALSLAQPWPLQAVVDGVLRPRGGVRPAHTELRIAVAVGIMVGLVALGATVSYWASRLLSAAGLHIAGALRMDVLGHLQRLELGYHAEHRVGDLSARVTSDVDRTQDMFVQVLATLFPNLLLVVGMFTVMMIIDPWFTLLALGASVPLSAATHRSRLQLRLASRASRKADGALASAATENLGAIHLVQAFNLQTDRLGRFRRLNTASVHAGLETVRLQSRFAPMVDLSGVLAAGLVLWFGAHRVLEGRLSLGVLLVFLSYLNSLFKPVKALTKLAMVVSKGTAAAERISAVLDTEPRIADRHDAIETTLTGGITFNHVTFSYGREPVLDDVTFTIAPGETVAIVGPTGAGKSTIAGLIPRLIDPTSGSIHFDGVDARDLSLASLRSQVAMVLQDSVLLEGTLRDNIVCGFSRATGRDVEQAARLALVYEFAARLPEGLDTPIGERGVNLSGGQRQRVAIARAILRNSPIIILDEPTSALDAASEELLVEALDNLPKGRTTIVIAHRLSTVRHADRIIVLDRGRVIEQGSHEQLMRISDGLYRKLTTFQVGQSSNDTSRDIELPPPLALPPTRPRNHEGALR
jgi:ATP-binding cassette, subfamily B, bacterial